MFSCFWDRENNSHWYLLHCFIEPQSSPNDLTLCETYSFSALFCPPCTTHVATGYTSVSSLAACTLKPYLMIKWSFFFSYHQRLYRTELSGGYRCLHLLLLSEMRNCPTDLANTLFMMLCCAYKSPDWNDHGFGETCLRSSCFSFLRTHAPFLNSVSHSSVKRKGDPIFYHLPPRRHSLSLSLSFF